MGNYERFLNIRLGRDNNITTGKIFERVISKERQGAYLGRTVQYIPHITDEIQLWVENIAHQPVRNDNNGVGGTPQICIIELGGTIGDIESAPFVEAFRFLQRRVGIENFLNVHLSPVLEPKSVGEQKTKPTQRSVQELRKLGLHPDLVSILLINDVIRVEILIDIFCHSLSFIHQSRLCVDVRIQYLTKSERKYLFFVMFQVIKLYQSTMLNLFTKYQLSYSNKMWSKLSTRYFDLIYQFHL